MVSTVSIEGLVPLSELVPSKSASTLHRWATVGVKGVKLETVRIGAKRYAKSDAFKRFIDDLNRETAAQ